MTRRLLLLLALLSAVPLLGCSNPDPENVMDVTALLARYERDRRRHDPLHFSEVDLGSFSVTQRRDPSSATPASSSDAESNGQTPPAAYDTKIYYIRFHLHAVVPDGLIDQFNELLATHQERVRGVVREAAQRCELEQLNDPTLGWLKSELIKSIHEVIQTPILRDVVFSDFSFERA